MRSRSYALSVTLPLAVAAVLLAPAVRPAYADFTVDTVNGTNDKTGSYVVNNGDTLDAGYNLTVGDAGNGVLVANSGGTVNAGNLNLAVGTGSLGGLAVNGGTVNLTSGLIAGFQGNGNVTVNSGSINLGFNIAVVGYMSGSTGTMTVYNGGSFTNDVSFNIGQVGNGTLNVNSGGTVTTGQGIIGQSGQGIANINGGTWNPSDIFIGNGSTNNALNITSGGMVTSHDSGRTLLGSSAVIYANNGTLVTSSLGAFGGGTGNIQVSGSGLTLGLTGSTASTFAGNIVNGSGGAGSLTLTQGSLTLTGMANMYSGGTTVKNGATISVGAYNALGTGGLTLSGGTLTATAFNGMINTVTNISTLSLTDSTVSYLDFGDPANKAKFAFNNPGFQSFNGTLKILNYDASADNKLIFAANLTSDQLSHIQFVNPAGQAAGTYDAMQSGSAQSGYEINVGALNVAGSGAAAPEPGSLAMALLGLSMAPAARLLRRRRTLAA